MTTHFRALVLAALAGAALAARGDDVENWTDLYLEHKLDDRWSVRLEEEVRWRDDVSDFYYYHTDLGLTWKARPWLDLNANIRHTDQKNGRGVWGEEERPHGAVTFKGTAAGFQIENRNRVEYRIRPERNDIVRYRNRLQVSRHVTFGAVAFDPYVSEEALIDTDMGDFNQFRSIAGLKAKLTKALRGDLYYAWIATESSTDWTDTHVIGLRLGCVF